MARPVVLILGGYGVFGRRIGANLAKHDDIELIIAGRDGKAAADFAQSLVPDRARALAVDAASPDAFGALMAMRPAVIVDTVGPFQARDLGLARQCAEQGVHYVDIADSRGHVAGIGTLDEIAKSHCAAIISGASTVPALSTAIVDDLAPHANDVLEIDVGISPGHRAPRGVATVSAILSYCGRPIPSVCGDTSEYGWGGLTRRHYPAPVGKRWLSNVDTPERELWRRRYPALEKATIRAGFEIGVFHLCLSALARGVRLGLVPSLARCTGVFLRIAKAGDHFGTDTGAMHVRVVTKAGIRTGTLVAEKGDGPQIPAAPAALTVKKLLALPGYAPLTARGAFPCIGLLTREEIMKELSGFAICYVASD